MLLFESLQNDLIGIVVSLVTVFIIFYKWRFQYWKRRNLPYLEPSIPFGNEQNPLTTKEHFGITIKRQYDTMKAKGWKHGGMFAFASPTYLVTDLEYLRNILNKDFEYFVSRGFYHNEKDDPLSAHLFAIGGAKWRNLRTKLTPTFTSGKMKAMFQTLVDCEPFLRKKIDFDVEQKNAIDIKEALGCFTTDVIGSCAFGLDCNAFQRETSPFRDFGKKVFESGPLRNLKIAFMMNFPNISRACSLKFIEDDVTKFFMGLVKDTVNHRENNNLTRKDFMQLLIDLKNNKLAQEEGFKHDGNSLTIEEIAAQSFVFFVAGFETSSTTMTFALYELAKNQDMQQRVRNEINTVLARHDGQITYDAIQEMKYMDQVISETLRKYPPVSAITRECVKDYKVSDDDVIIEKGTMVLIPVLGLHHDEEYYPDPERFDPERFNEENKAFRKNYTYMPFGEGPRLCIGMRFGLMQSKVGLTSLLQNFNFTVNSKTQEPLKMKALSFVLAAVGEIWLDAQKI